MWGLAQYSPQQAGESEDEIAIAYLKADDPLDSVVSRYRLAVMDRDGSNSRIIFPSQDKQGIAPKDLDYRGFVWSPDARQIALVYQGNLYLIDVVTGLEQQLTRDGLATNPRWTP
jgi:Tol biopolymer transport system component